MKDRTFYVIIGAASAAILGFFYYKKKKSTGVVNSDTNTTSSTSPTSFVESIKSVFKPTISNVQPKNSIKLPDGRFFDGITGQLYDKSGKKVVGYQVFDMNEPSLSIPTANGSTNVENFNKYFFNLNITNPSSATYLPQENGYGYWVVYNPAPEYSQDKAYADKYDSMFGLNKWLDVQQYSSDWGSNLGGSPFSMGGKPSE